MTHLKRHARISRGGQVSIPAEVRHRWSTSRILLEDLGDSLVIHPAPDDPLSGLRGAFADPSRPGSAELRKHARAEDADRLSGPGEA
jgi:bifunctional DNA-binding transcriptional regulator/antitoxin component of YhaV-PrlF toxin-antitoxin module